MTELTEAGQKLADALLEAKMEFVPRDDGYLLSIPTLNTAAALLLTAPEGEGAGLRDALKPFASLEFSFDGFSLDPAELVVLGRCCGRFNPTEHSHLQKAIDAARAALASPQPAVDGPIAAGVGRERVLPFQEMQTEPTPPEEAKRLLVLHAKTTLADVLLKYAPQFDYDNAAIADALTEASIIVDATLTPPADPKTPDAGVGEAVRDLVDTLLQEHEQLVREEVNDSQKDHDTTRFDRAYAAVLALTQPAPVGEDETGVREALKATTASLVAAISLLSRGSKKAAPSNAMFDLMIADYQKAVDQARAALAPQPPKAETPAGVGDELALEYLVGTMERAMSCRRGGCEVFYIPPGGHGSGAELLAKLKNYVAALSAAPAARPGDGFVLVPREPTRAMNNAGSYCHRSENGEADEIYAAMIAAAPAADGGRA